MAGTRRAATAAAPVFLLLLGACGAPEKIAPGRAGSSEALGAPLAIPAGPRSSAPEISAFGDRVVVSWIEPGPDGAPALRYAERSSGGWGPACTVASDRRISCEAMDVCGVVPMAEGALAAYWLIHVDGTAHERAIHVSESHDGGTTWSLPVEPHRRDAPGSRGMATVVPRPGRDRFDIVWLDARAGEESDYGEGGTALYAASFTGTRFEAESVLDPRVCDCCKTAATAGPAGPIVAYRGRGPGEQRDIDVVSQIDGRWTAPHRVGDDGWTITACPTNGHAIASRGARVVVAWYTAAKATPSVRAAFSDDAGKTFAPTLRIDDAHPLGRVDADLFPDGSAAVVWLERLGEGAIVQLRRVAPVGPAGAPLTIAATGAARTSGYPRVAVVGPREAIVVWTDTTSEASRVRGAQITVP